MMYGEFADIISIADDIYKLFNDNIQYCNIKQSFEEIVNKCSSSKENQCGIKQILQNAQKQVFEIIKTVTSSIDIITHTKAHNRKEFYEMMFEVGEDVGELLTALLGI